jgi:LPXTG-site transpeptidase (sortase) family protein
MKTIITKMPPVLRVVSLYLVVVALLSLIAYIIQADKPAAAVYAVPMVQVQSPAVESEEISGVPSKVSIPRLGIDLSIVNGTYDRERDEWTLTDDSVQFASMTSLPSNKNGNTFLYGHNTAAVLQPVKDIIPGDILTVTTTNGRVFTYTYISDMTVTPDQTNVITPISSDPQVTLMTCEGWLSEVRRIMYFKFEGVS